MRAAAPRLAEQALRPEVHRRLAYARRLTDRAWAVQLIGAVQAGEDLGDVESPWWRELWGRRLSSAEFPERAADPKQGRLVQALLELTPPFPDERQLGRLLITHGLDGLARIAEAGHPATEGPGRDRREAPDW
jgi:hypothetical protein